MHFCGGRQGRLPNWRVPDEVRNMSGRDRLESILWGEQLRTFVPFSGWDPAVCFTEAMGEGIKFMIQRQGYEPWGVAFDKQSVYNVGGGPVWYSRREQVERLERLDPSLLSWAVLLDAPNYDWRWEREWRIVRPSVSGEGVALSELRLACLLVGDPSWTGARYDYCIAADTGQPRWDNFLPRLLPRGLPRGWWNAITGNIEWLAPLW
jgi:hypothetical protein